MFGFGRKQVVAATPSTTGGGISPTSADDRVLSEGEVIRRKGGLKKRPEYGPVINGGTMSTASNAAGGGMAAITSRRVVMDKTVTGGMEEVENVATPVTKTKKKATEGRKSPKASSVRGEITGDRTKSSEAVESWPAPADDGGPAMGDSEEALSSDDEEYATNQDLDVPEDGYIFSGIIRGLPRQDDALGSIEISTVNGEFWLALNGLMLFNCPKEDYRQCFVFFCKRAQPRLGRVDIRLAVKALVPSTDSTGALPDPPDYAEIGVSGGMDYNGDIRFSLADVLDIRHGKARSFPLDPRKFKSLIIAKPGVWNLRGGITSPTIIYAWAGLNPAGSAPQERSRAAAERVRRSSFNLGLGPSMSSAVLRSTGLRGRTYADMDSIASDCFGLLGKPKIGGSLNFAEFKIVLGQLRVKFTEARAFVWFDVCDADGSGTLEFDEFRHLLAVVSVAHPPELLTFRDVYLFFSVDNAKEAAEYEANLEAFLNGVVGSKLPTTREPVRRTYPPVDFLAVFEILTAFKVESGLRISREKVEAIFQVAEARTNTGLIGYHETRAMWTSLVDPATELNKRGVSKQRVLVERMAPSADYDDLKMVLVRLMDTEEHHMIEDLSCAVIEADRERDKWYASNEINRFEVERVGKRDARNVRRKKALLEREKRLRLASESLATQERARVEADLDARIKTAALLREVEERNQLAESRAELEKIEADRRARLGLDTLDLSNRNIQFIPALMWAEGLPIDRLRHLVILDISRNNIGVLPGINLFSNLSILEKLDISDNQLRDLPPEIGLVTSLLILSLSGNALSTLPDSLCNLKSLRRLTVNSNRLVKLPERIGDLKRLELLNLSSNKLQEIPDSLVELFRLTHLLLQCNNIRYLPVEMGSCRALKRLDVRSNSLAELPLTIFKCQYLTHIFASNNVMRCLPLLIGSCSALTLLDVARNNLHTFPDTFGKLSSLILIDASENEITYFGDAVFAGLVNLQRANFSKNRLETLPRSFGRNAELQVLDLSSNRLTSLPRDFAALGALRALNLTQNLLGGIGKGGGVVLPDNIGGCHNLEWLDCSYNSAGSFSPSIALCTKLRHLNVSHNSLTELSMSLTALEGLETLDASNNDIIRIVPDIGFATQLRALDVSVNKLVSVPSSLASCVSLRHLHLYNNRITSLPLSIAWLLPQLLTFDVGKNPLKGLPPKWVCGDVVGASLLNLRFSRERIEPLIVTMRRARAQDIASRIAGLTAVAEDALDAERLSMIREDTRLLSRGPSVVVAELSAHSSRHASWGRNGPGGERDALLEWGTFIASELLIDEVEQERSVDNVKKMLSDRAAEDAFAILMRDQSSSESGSDSGSDSGTAYIGGDKHSGSKGASAGVGRAPIFKPNGVSNSGGPLLQPSDFKGGSGSGGGPLLQPSDFKGDSGSGGGLLFNSGSGPNASDDTAMARGDVVGDTQSTTSEPVILTAEEVHNKLQASALADSLGYNRVSGKKKLTRFEPLPKWGGNITLQLKDEERGINEQIHREMTGERIAPPADFMFRKMLSPLHRPTQLELDRRRHVQMRPLSIALNRALAMKSNNDRDEEIMKRLLERDSEESTPASSQPNTRPGTASNVAVRRPSRLLQYAIESSHGAVVRPSSAYSYLSSKSSLESGARGHHSSVNEYGRPLSVQSMRRVLPSALARLTGSHVSEGQLLSYAGVLVATGAVPAPGMERAAFFGTDELREMEMQARANAAVLPLADSLALTEAGGIALEASRLSTLLEENSRLLEENSMISLDNMSILSVDQRFTGGNSGSEGSSDGETGLVGRMAGVGIGEKNTFQGESLQSGSSNKGIPARHRNMFEARQAQIASSLQTAEALRERTKHGTRGERRRRAAARGEGGVSTNDISVFSSADGSLWEETVGSAEPDASDGSAGGTVAFNESDWPIATASRANEFRNEGRPSTSDAGVNVYNFVVSPPSRGASRSGTSSRPTKENVGMSGGGGGGGEVAPLSDSPFASPLLLTQRPILITSSLASELPTSSPAASVPMRNKTLPLNTLLKDVSAAAAVPVSAAAAVPVSAAAAVPVSAATALPVSAAVAVPMPNKVGRGGAFISMDIALAASADPTGAVIAEDAAWAARLNLRLPSAVTAKPTGHRPEGTIDLEKTAGLPSKTDFALYLAASISEVDETAGRVPLPAVSALTAGRAPLSAVSALSAVPSISSPSKGNTDRAAAIDNNIVVVSPLSAERARALTLAPSPPKSDRFFELFPKQKAVATIAVEGFGEGQTTSASVRMRARLANHVGNSSQLFDSDPYSAQPVQSFSAKVDNDSARLRGLALGLDPSQQSGDPGSGPSDIHASFDANARGLLDGNIRITLQDATSLARIKIKERINKLRSARGARERFEKGLARGGQPSDARAVSKSQPPPLIAERGSSGGGKRDSSQPPAVRHGLPNAEQTGDDDDEADIIASAATNAVSAALDVGDSERVKRVVGSINTANARRWRAVGAEANVEVSKALAMNRAAFDKVLARRMQLEAQAVMRANTTRVMLRKMGMDENGITIDPRTVMTVEELAVDDMRVELESLETAKTMTRTVTGFRKDKLSFAVRTATATIYDYDMSLRAIDAYDAMLSGGVLYAAHSAKIFQLEKTRKSLALKLGIDLRRVGDIQNVGSPPPVSIEDRLAVVRSDGSDMAVTLAAKDATIAQVKASLEAEAPAPLVDIARPCDHSIDSMFTRARAALAAKRSQIESSVALREEEAIRNSLEALTAPSKPLRSSKDELTVHPLIAALSFGNTISTSGLEANGFALALGTGGVYMPLRDPATFLRSDPYTLDTAVLGAPTSGIRLLQPAFGVGYFHSLYKGNPYGSSEVVRGTSLHNPESLEDKDARSFGDKQPNLVRISVPNPTDFTGIDLNATDRAKGAPASESLLERRLLHEKRLFKAQDDVRLYRFIGGVRFIDTEEDEEKLRCEKEISSLSATFSGAAKKNPLEALEAFAQRTLNNTDTAKHVVGGDGGGVVAKRLLPLASMSSDGMKARHASLSGVSGVSAGRNSAYTAVGSENADGELTSMGMAPARDDEEADYEGEEGAGARPGVGEGEGEGEGDGERKIDSSRNTAIIRRTNPFGVPSGVPKALTQRRVDTATVLTDPNDRGFFSMGSKWHPATFMNGYTSGNVADFLRIQAIFAPFAESEWMTRGGAYLEKRLLATDFLRAVRRRMQSRDPLTGILDSVLFGEAPRVKGQPRPGDPDWIERWDPQLMVPLRCYYALCMKEGVPPLYGETTPEILAARKSMGEIVQKHRAAVGPRTLRAINEQWDAYVKLYVVDPLDIKRRADDQEERSSANQNEAQKCGIMKLFRAAAKKKKIIEKRREEIMKERSEAAGKLATEISARNAEAAATTRERDISMGLNPNNHLSRKAKGIHAASAAAREMGLN